MSKRPIPGEYYRHLVRGTTYLYIGVSRHSGDKSETDVYQDIESGQIWNRPVWDTDCCWTSKGSNGKERFIQLSEEEKNELSINRVKARLMTGI